MPTYFVTAHRGKSTKAKPKPYASEAKAHAAFVKAASDPSVWWVSLTFKFTAG